MVSALKTNNSENPINSFIKHFSADTKKEYVYEEIRPRSSYVDKSIQNLAVNSIIEGYFPKENLVKDMAVKRINKSLCWILGILIFVVVISYYFVVACEIKLNDLSRETVILNNENEELQNKLDMLKSFNNVDKSLQQNNILQKAGQVIETQEVQLSSKELNKSSSSKKIFNTTIGF